MGEREAFKSELVFCWKERGFIHWLGWNPYFERITKWDRKPFGCLAFVIPLWDMKKIRGESDTMRRKKRYFEDSLFSFTVYRYDRYQSTRGVCWEGYR